MKLLGKKGIMRRYADNQRLAEGFDGFIFGQCKQPVGDLRYGSAEKPVADVGCGVAAVYNVMRLLGKYQPVADVARDCELLRLAFFGGRFGTATKKLGRYFSYHGVSCREFRRCGEFKAALDGCKAAIVCTWNDRITDGIHFYCIYPDGGGFSSLNGLLSVMFFEHSVKFPPALLITVLIWSPDRTRTALR